MLVTLLESHVLINQKDMLTELGIGYELNNI